MMYAVDGLPLALSPIHMDFPMRDPWAKGLRLLLERPLALNEHERSQRQHRRLALRAAAAKPQASLQEP